MGPAPQLAKPMKHQHAQDGHPGKVVHHVMLPTGADGVGHDEEQKHDGYKACAIKGIAGAVAVHKQRGMKPNLQHQKEGEAKGVIGVPIHFLRLHKHGNNIAHAKDEHQDEEQLNIRRFFQGAKRLAAYVQNKFRFRQKCSLALLLRICSSLWRLSAKYWCLLR